MGHRKGKVFQAEKHQYFFSLVERIERMVYDGDRERLNNAYWDLAGPVDARIKSLETELEAVKNYRKRIYKRYLHGIFHIRKCKGCNGHGVVTGVSSDGSYDDHPCPFCNK